MFLCPGWYRPGPAASSSACGVGVPTSNARPECVVHDGPGSRPSHCPARLGLRERMGVGGWAWPLSGHTPFTQVGPRDSGRTWCFLSPGHWPPAPALAVQAFLLTAAQLSLPQLAPSTPRQARAPLPGMQRPSPGPDPLPVATLGSRRSMKREQALSGPRAFCARGRAVRTHPCRGCSPPGLSRGLLCSLSTPASPTDGEGAS